jgi:hypothetical protein
MHYAVARVLALVPDLFFASKIEATLSAAGHDVTIVANSEEARAAPADVVIVDLEQIGAETGGSAGRPRLGFYSHVNAGAKRNAEEAGFDLVVPRSRMAREMPQLVAKLLDRPGGPDS